MTRLIARPAVRYDNAAPWGYDDMADPKDESRQCEYCGKAGTEAQGVRFDRGLGKWVCGPCWVETKPPGSGVRGKRFDAGA